MKFLKKMNNITVKVAKGMLAIFMIKLVLFSGVLIFQSCQTEEDSNYDSAQLENEFLSSLFESENDINSIPINTPFNSIDYDGNLFLSSAGNEDQILSQEPQTRTVCLRQIINNETDDTQGEEIETIGELMEIGNIISIDGIGIGDGDDIDDSDDSSEVVTHCFEVPIQPTSSALTSSVSSAKNYLRQKGYSDTDISEIVDGGKEENLIPLVIGLIEADNEQSNSTVLNDFNQLFGNSLHAQSWGSIVGCAIASTGLDVFNDLRSLQGKEKKVRNKILKRAFRKIAAKFLGPIGIAITVIEFGTCVALAS